jgi:Tol biopolymer transport system component
MVTGKKAFEGKSQASLIGAIMHAEPPAMSTIQPLTPPMLDRVVKKCLAKAPEERWQSAKDLHDELRWVAEGAVVPTAVTGTPSGRSRERLAWIVTALLAVAVAAALAVPYVRTPPALPEMRTEINTPATTDPISFAISPDGRRLIFVASGDGPSRLWLRPLDATIAQPLAGTEGAAYPFWSPDSRSVGFFADGKLKRMDIETGPPQSLANASLGRGGTWSPDGVILFNATAGSGLFRVPVSGGEAVEVTKLAPGQALHSFPNFLPRGRQFLFWARGTPDTGGIYLGSLDAAEPTRLTAADSAGAYAAAGWLLFVRQGTLIGRRFDAGRGKLTGDTLTVADPVGFDPDWGVGAFSMSAAGLVTYRAAGGRATQLVWFDRSGKALGTMGPRDENSLQSPRLSPDGRRVAVLRTVQQNTDVWLLDAAHPTRFTFDASLDLFPVWSPDGRRIVFSSYRKGPQNLYQKLSNGAGGEELLLESPLNKAPSDWSPDGRFLLYSVGDPKTGLDVWVLPMDGDRKPFALLNSRFNERWAVFSPDGRWVAYQSDESGQYEIYVRPFSKGVGTPSTAAAPGTPGGQWQVSTSGGITPRWAPDGKELYYIAPDGKAMAVPTVMKEATIELGVPTALFQTRIAYGGMSSVYIGPQYDVATDGRFLINVTTDEATASPITIIFNWAGLKR